MSAPVPAYYALNADPADNPHQPMSGFQSLHQPGAKMHAVRARAQLAEPVPTQTAQDYGDVYLDYSSARPSNAALLAVPRLAGMCRYLSPLNPDGTYYGPTAAK